MPSQCSMARTVVAFSVAPLSPCSTGFADRVQALGQRRPPDQVDRVIGAVAVMHLEADDLAAEQVEDQVQIEPSSRHMRGQERDVPAPDLARRRGDMRGGWTRAAWRLGAAAAGHLPVRAQHPMEARTRWRCRYPRRPASARCARAGSRRSGVGWPRRRCGRVPPPSTRAKVSGDRVRPPVPPGQPVACASAGRCAGRSRPARRRAPAARRRPGPHRCLDQGHAIFQAGHASSPWWKIAWSFFDSTSKAAVSANALSLRRNSRSSSLTRRRSCLVHRHGLPRARRDPRSRRASKRPARSETRRARGTRHRARPRPAAVAITASSRAAAVQRCGCRARCAGEASARHRSSVATLIPTCRHIRNRRTLRRQQPRHHAFLKL